MPRTFQRTAEEARHKGRVRRNQAKRRDIEAEYIAPYLLEQSAIEPMPIIDIVREPVPAGPVLVIDNDQNSAVTASGAVEPLRRRTFASDVELAAWALENPEQITVGQAAVLRRCLQQQTASQLFRMSGIDLEALRTVLRAVA